MKKIGLPTQMIIGLILGVIVGYIVSSNQWNGEWLKILGDIFIKLMRMLVVPLVFTTLVAGAASIADVSKLGRIALKTICFYLATTAIAIAIGLLFANLLTPGVGLNLSLENIQAKDITPPNITQVLMNIIPMNPMEALSGANMLQIIFFAILLGFVLSTQGEKAKPVTAFFDVFAETMIKMTSAVMYYAPIGVFGLIAFTVSRHGMDVILPLIKLIGVMYLAAFVHILLVYIPCIMISGVKLGSFFKECSSPLLIAFTTCSSAAALSANMRSVERLGAQKPVYSFSIPLGNTINMDGSAIYLGIAAIFAAQVYGIDMPFDKQLTVVLMATLASIGTMGVPAAALVMMSMVFTQVGIPLEAIALIAGVDRIVDMARTSVNVFGDATAALLVSKTEKNK